jgi:hypothetical protein
VFGDECLVFGDEGLGFGDEGLGFPYLPLTGKVTVAEEFWTVSMIFFHTKGLTNG